MGITKAERIKQTAQAVANLTSAIAVLEAEEATPDKLEPYQKALKKYEAQLAKLQKGARVPARG